MIETSLSKDSLAQMFLSTLISMHPDYSCVWIYIHHAPAFTAVENDVNKDYIFLIGTFHFHLARNEMLHE